MKKRSREAGPRKRRRVDYDPPKMQRQNPAANKLVHGGLGLLSGLDADKAPVTALVLELHEAGNHRKERVVLALANVFTCLMLGAALAHQNGAGVDQLPAEALDAQPLAV